MNLKQYCSLIAAAAALYCMGNANATTLYQTFTLPAPNTTWQSYSMPLFGNMPGLASQWRVAATDADIGAPVGALATDAEMQAVLAQLGALEIGGFLAAGHTATTLYGAGFFLDNPNLAGLAASDFTANENGWKQMVNQGPGGGLGWSSVGGNPGGHISGFADLTTPELLTFSAPAAYLGNQSAAHGNALTFDFWTYEYALSPVPATFDYGVAILTTVPEPSTLFLLVAGISVMVNKRRF